MTTMLRLGLFAFVVYAAVGCGCATPDTHPNACNLPSPPTGCGALCSPAVPCPAGTHCSSNHCAAECSSTHACPGGARCAADGTCAMADAAVTRDTTIDSPFIPTDQGPPPDNTCASVDIGTMMATPNVIVIVDESGSMGTNNFPVTSSTTRWAALENALMAPGGIVDTLQPSVRWGMAWFHGGAGCPGNTRTVACALNNYTAINTVYRGLRPGGATPTGEAIEFVLMNRTMLISDPAQPTIFILATDGDPNMCADSGNTALGMSTTITALDNAHTLGIDTYVIGVGTDALASNLQAMANAGVGSSGTPPARWYQPMDTAGLATALSTIVGGIRSCNLTLMGMIDPAQACSGTVTLAGTPLVCDDPNGWHAIDMSHIQLDGTACSMLLAGSTPLQATFPCGVILR